MFVYERQNQILSVLEERQFATVDYLAKVLFTSPATVRRDLACMEQNGLLRRVRGGAVRIEGAEQDKPLLMRNRSEMEKKEKIARLALPLLKGSSTLFLDSSSTVTELARQFESLREVTVMTCGMATLQLLNDTTALNVLCCGGRLRNRSSFVGSTAVKAIRNFRADLFLFSCCGLTAEFGSSEADESNATVKRAMLEQAKRRILLCDSTKIGKDYFHRVCSLDEVDVIVTDTKPDEEFFNHAPCPVLYQ